MLKSTILIVILAASAKTQFNEGCITWNTPKNTCLECYRRQVVKKGCGPLLPVTDHCLVHTEHPGQDVRCTLCRPGYGITVQGSCAPINIFNCVLAVFANPAKTFKICIACGNGQYPNLRRSACTAKVTKPIDNCEWGARGKDELTCVRCSPGYAVSLDGKSCVVRSASNGTLGCWQVNVDNKPCVRCDALGDYSQQPNGVC